MNCTRSALQLYRIKLLFFFSEADVERRCKMTSSIYVDCFCILHFEYDMRFFLDMANVSTL